MEGGTPFQQSFSLPGVDSIPVQQEFPGLNSTPKIPEINTSNVTYKVDKLEQIVNILDKVSGIPRDYADCKNALRNEYDGKMNTMIDATSASAYCAANTALKHIDGIPGASMIDKGLKHGLNNVVNAVGSDPVFPNIFDPLQSKMQSIESVFSTTQINSQNVSDSQVLQINDTTSRFDSIMNNSIVDPSTLSIPQLNTQPLISTFEVRPNPWNPNPHNYLYDCFKQQ
jgi:hypothetical protein